MAEETSTLTIAYAREEPGHGSGPWLLAWRRLRRKRIAMLSLVFILIFYAAGISAPLLGKLGAIPPYTQQDLEHSLEGPSLEHPFGRDRLGRDQLSRVVWASQTTVIVTVATLLTGGLVMAVGLGLLCGYVGGWVDAAIMRVGDILASVPTILMLILINATMKERVRSIARDFEDITGIPGFVDSGAPDYFLIFGALSLFSWVGGARIIRSQVLALRETEFMTAAWSLGASTPRLLFRHLLPNISNFLIVSLSLMLAGIVGSEIVLTWFGIGIQPPHPSFGALIFDGGGSRQLNESPHLLLFPGGIVIILIFAFNLLGDALTDVFTPKAH